MSSLNPEILLLLGRTILFHLALISLASPRKSRSVKAQYIPKMLMSLVILFDVAEQLEYSIRRRQRPPSRETPICSRNHIVLSRTNSPTIIMSSLNPDIPLLLNRTSHPSFVQLNYAVDEAMKEMEKILDMGPRPFL
jgi:hypothetical protein